MRPHSNHQDHSFTPIVPRQFVVAFAAIVMLIQAGCQTTNLFTQRVATIATIGTTPIVEIEAVKLASDGNALINRFIRSPREPSERTKLLLRQYDLLDQYEKDPDGVLSYFQGAGLSVPTIEEVHGVAEIAEIQADWAMTIGQTDRAVGLYSTAVLHACQFLFDSNHDTNRNAYDPQFRSICDIYNRSLEGLLRQLCASGQLNPGEMVEIGNTHQKLEFQVQIEGRWRNQPFERFELVNDYEASGIANQFHTYGLGVPLIAVREKQPETVSSHEKYYPPDLTVALTAFMHLLPDEMDSFHSKRVNREPKSKVRRAVLTLYDPLEQTEVVTESKVVPLESNITTPLAFALRDRLFNKSVFATASLLDAEFAPEFYKMFMLEPYDPDKIPVVMVHGLWSSLVTWVHMYNDLRADPNIQSNYQFWFYSYPTGQPFWVSAQQLRRELKNIRQELDPQSESEAFDQMVLVGHSMGGLMSLMQATESEGNFWKEISDDPIESFAGEPETLELLKETFYFQANPSIERIITIATPLNGSEFANGATRWVSQRLFNLPSAVTQDFQDVAKLNKDKLNKSSLLSRMTSIDSLATNNPMFEALARSEISPAVKIHNIIGRHRHKLMQHVVNSDSESSSDGVVSFASANNEQARSQVFVDAEHSEIHQEPSSIHEVHRVLLEHLAEKNRIRPRETSQKRDQQTVAPGPFLLKR